MTTQHTPTPWAAIEHTVCSDRYVIADLVGFENADSNTNFIVRACNAHDELVAALQMAVKCLDLYGQPSAQSAIKAARAALAKVSK